MITDGHYHYEQGRSWKITPILVKELSKGVTANFLILRESIDIITTIPSTGIVRGEDTRTSHTMKVIARIKEMSHHESPYNNGEPSHSTSKHQIMPPHQHRDKEEGNKDEESHQHESHRNKEMSHHESPYNKNDHKLGAGVARAPLSYIDESSIQGHSNRHHKSRGQPKIGDDPYDGTKGPLQMPDQWAPVAAFSSTGAPAATLSYNKVKKDGAPQPLRESVVEEKKESDVLPVDNEQRGGPKRKGRASADTAEEEKQETRRVFQMHPGAVWEGEDLEQGEDASVVADSPNESLPDSYDEAGLISAHVVEEPMTVSAVPTIDNDKRWSSWRRKTLLIGSLGVVVIVGLVVGLVVGMVKDTPATEPVVASSVVPGCVGSVALSWGDPHFVTFDNFEYDCQGVGDFVLVRALNGTFDVQARFTASSDKLVSTISAVAIAEGAQAPKIELILPDTPSSETSTVSGCPLDLYVNGERRNILSGSGQDDAVQVNVSDNRVNVAYPSSGATVTITAMHSSSGLSSSKNGCYLNTFVCLPESTPSLGNVVGLMGTPNNNISDDWMDSEGNNIELPSTLNERLYETAYTYCMENWCIRNAADSLFTYKESSTFIEKCDAPYPGSVDYESSSEELKAICGDRVACLIDGTVGGTEDAENALQTNQELEAARGDSQTPPPSSTLPPQTPSPTVVPTPPPIEPTPSPTLVSTTPVIEPTPVPTAATPAPVSPVAPIVEASADNDSCENAAGPLTVDGRALIGSNVNAKTTGPLCETNYVGPGVWSSFVGTGRRVMLSTCTDGTDFDTVLAVYSTSDGTCGSRKCIDVYDEGYYENSWCPAKGRADAITVDTVANELYYVAVIGDGFGTTGNFGLLAFDESNSCDNATGPLPVDGSITNGSNVNARMTGPLCETNYVGPGVWYTFVGTGRRVMLSTCTDRTDFDTVLAVYSTSDGTCGSLKCIDVYDEGYYENSWCPAKGRADAITVDTVANELYYVAVIGDGFGTTGNFGLLAFDESNSCDNATGPLPVDGSITNGSNVNARMTGPLCETRLCWSWRLVHVCRDGQTCHALNMHRQNRLRHGAGCIQHFRWHLWQPKMH